MIESFGNKAAKNIWEFDTSKDFPAHLHVRAKALLTIMYSTKTLADLKLKGSPPNIKLHALKGNQKGEWSISLENGSPWRMTYRFDKGDFSNIKIEDYHD